MTVTDLYNLMPLIILAGASVVIMLCIALKFSHQLIQLISLLSFAVTFFSLFSLDVSTPYIIRPLLIIDRFGLFYTGLIVLSALVVNVLSYIYFEEKEESPKEYYILLLLCTLGASVLVVSTHFITLFLGLEILSVGLYALIAYLRFRHHAIEAGVKYLVLAAFSSAFLLFGMALVYAFTGTMEFAEIAAKLSASASPLPAIVLTGFGLMIIGVGFKLAVVPFHMWTPDIYEGAPPPVAAFIATVSKGGMFALLLRFFNAINGYQYETVVLIFTGIAVISMLAGNLLALQQKNIKRLLAYSSIAHLGYLLVAFLAGGAQGMQAGSFYLMAYFITLTGAFGIVALHSTKERDAEWIEDYKGFFWRKPLSATILGAMMLSLAGIPLTAGFIGKFYLVAAGVNTHLWVALFVLVISSVIGLFYYLRVITMMFASVEGYEQSVKNLHPVFYAASSVMLSALTLLSIYFGVYPAPVLKLIERLVAGL